MSRKKNDQDNVTGKLNRRNFFKYMGVTGTMVAGMNTRASAATVSKSSRSRSPMGVLVDTTWCGGCRSCEAACNQANKLPEPEKPFDDDEVLNTIRDTSPTAYTVVNRYTTSEDEEVTRKRQCMHCLEPACSSVCIIRALEKQSNGPVTYREDLCIGCRYCMVACPFEIPKFEYEKAKPLIRKCEFCFERQADGKKPACVEACPNEALIYGPRDELLEEAKKRIYTNPDDYVHHIYGEHEVGGTTWMYLSAVPFEKIGLPKMKSKPYPEYTKGAMGAVPMIMLLWPALLLGLNQFTQRTEQSDVETRHHADSHSKGIR